MIRQGYYLKYPYDGFRNYRFANLILLQKDRLHLIINDQRKTAITDLFFLLDSDYSKITKSYEEYYSTVNTVKKTSGSPTRKTFIMKGWDNNNVLMVGTVTLERGAVELGGSMTLATQTTYSNVISRSFTITGREPFTMRDRTYPWKQESPGSYWHFTAMSTFFRMS